MVGSVIGLGMLLAPGPYRVRISHQAVSTAVERALEGASRRLEDGRCAAVSSEFSDGDGRPLQRNLEALSSSAPQYLALIGFYDGWQAAQTPERD